MGKDLCRCHGPGERRERFAFLVTEISMIDFGMRLSGMYFDLIRA